MREPSAMLCCRNAMRVWLVKSGMTAMPARPLVRIKGARRGPWRQGVFVGAKVLRLAAGLSTAMGGSFAALESYPTVLSIDTMLQKLKGFFSFHRLLLSFLRS